MLERDVSDRAMEFIAATHRADSRCEKVLELLQQRYPGMSKEEITMRIHLLALGMPC